jgi:hypothetical protein
MSLKEFVLNGYTQMMASKGRVMSHLMTGFTILLRNRPVRSYECRLQEYNPTEPCLEFGKKSSE